MTPETEALLDKIAKLEAKAKGTTNPAEAEIFAAKVAELLAKHNLDEAMLRSRDASREQGPIGRHPFKMRVPDAWRERIVSGVARVYFCRITFQLKGPQTADPWTWTFVGREHNAIVAAAMAEYLIATVKRMAREYSPRKAEQANYRKGAGDRLYRRLWEMAEVQRQPDPGKASDGTSLMVVTEDQALADYLGDINQIRSKTHKHGRGSAEGWDEAGDISLNTQIKETRAERMLS